MKIAIPTLEGKLATHFGHCEKFAIIDIDVDGKKIIKREDLTPPPHEPGVLSRWLGEQGVTHIIAGGMGAHAHNLFTEQKIEVVIGAEIELPELLVNKLLSGDLKSGQNSCDH